MLSLHSQYCVSHLCHLCSHCILRLFSFCILNVCAEGFWITRLPLCPLQRLPRSPKTWIIDINFPIFALLLFPLLKVELESPTLKIFHLSLETLLLSILPKPQLGNSCLSSYNPQFKFFLPNILSQRSVISSFQAKTKDRFFWTTVINSSLCFPDPKTELKLGIVAEKAEFKLVLSYMSRWAAILNSSSFGLVYFCAWQGISQFESTRQSNEFRGCSEDEK